MKHVLSVACALTLMVATPAALAAGNIAAGKKKSATCAACHGVHGISTAKLYPILAGQHESYLVHALKQYKSGKRKSPIMNGMAAGLNAQDIENLAAYFASQPSPLDTLPRPSW